MYLRWYITSIQTRKDGPYQRTKTLQFRDSFDDEWEDVEEEDFGEEIRFGEQKEY